MTKDLRGKVEPLPVVKPYEPVPYTAYDLADPFGPAKIELARPRAPGRDAGAGSSPISTGRRSRSRRSRSRVAAGWSGTLERGKQTFALVQRRTPGCTASGSGTTWDRTSA